MKRFGMMVVVMFLVVAAPGVVFADTLFAQDQKLGKQFKEMREAAKQISYVHAELDEFVTDTIKNGGLDWGAFKHRFGQMREQLEPVYRWSMANADNGGLLPYDACPVVAQNLRQAFGMLDRVYKRAPGFAKSMVTCRPLARKSGEIADWSVAQAKGGCEALLTAMAELKKACDGLKKVSGKTRCTYCGSWVTVTRDAGGRVKPCSQCGGILED